MISEEIKEKIIDLDYLGISKEKIAKMLEVSKGTVFNVVIEHEREIGKANRDAIRRLANNANKNNISFEQIHKGVKINTFLEKKSGPMAQRQKKAPFFFTLSTRCFWGHHFPSRFF